MPIYVSNATELLNALKSASGGESILLRSGDYGNLELRDFNFNSTVSIASADPARPATFAGGNLVRVSNITFDNVVVDYEAQGAASSTFGVFNVRESSEVHFMNSTFDGDLVGGSASGKALNFSGCTNVSVEGSTFNNFYKTVSFASCNNVRIVDNDISHFQVDGLNVSDSNNVLVEGNHIHDVLTFDGRSHRDMLQMWTIDGRSMTNIIVRDNFFDTGTGSWSHMIYFGENGPGTQGLYIDVTIENNLMYGAHHNGIVIGQADGLQVKNNTMIVDPFADDSGRNASGVPKIIIPSDSTNVVISGNVAPTIIAGSTASVSNNIILDFSNLQSNNYVGKNFVDPLSPNPSMGDLQAKPGGLVAQMGVGSDLNAANFHVNSTGNNTGGSSGTTPEAEFTVSTVDNDTFTFNAEVAGAGHTFLWDFGDGVEGIGKTVTHSYREPGSFTVRLTLTAPDGTREIVTNKVDIDLPPPGDGKFEHVFNGTSRGDIFDGTDHNDLMIGSGGNDTLRGRAGDDRLDGGYKHDRINGGLGNDILTGGGGSDTFFFAATSGADRITDFSHQDTIDLTQKGVSSFELLMKMASTANGDTTINFVNGDSIVIEGIDKGEFSASDFLF